MDGDEERQIAHGFRRQGKPYTVGSANRGRCEAAQSDEDNENPGEHPETPALCFLPRLGFFLFRRFDFVQLLQRKVTVT
ncbi:MAG: hypothetical protein ACREOR_08055, partial [Candidatus Binatia bacterium]